MEMKFRYRFEAAHRFTTAASNACKTPHGHTWHATLHLQSLRSLNQDGMVVEFSKAKSFWKTLITETFDHSFMCNYRDALIEPLLAAHPEARLLRFPGDPTTEAISLLLFAKAEQSIIAANLTQDVRVIGVNIEETPTNSIFCSRQFFEENISRFENFSGWWTSIDPADRSFKTAD
jgi:6-pyruvoyl-tetrahydropterin synthase